MNREKMTPETPSPQNPIPADPVPPLPRKKLPQAGEQAYVVIQKPSMWRGMMGWTAWMLAGFCLLAVMNFASSQHAYFDTTGGIREKYHSLSKDTSGDRIAVLNATGMITSGDGFVKRQIDRIREDDSIKGIVLRIESPGGSVYGSDFLFHHLKQLRADRKVPMVVSMGSVAASGGYYIAMAVGDQEKCIYAEPLTTTGSIGVIIPHYNIAGLMEKYDVVDDSLATHPRKSILSMTRPMTQDDRVVLEKYMGHAFDRFKEVIKEGRPQFVDNPDALDELATGEMFTAEQAKELGLIDEIGFVEDAIDRVLEMAQLDREETSVITYTLPITMWDTMLGKAPQVASPTDQQVLASLLRLNTQHAYYLSAPVANWLSAERD